MLGPVQVWTDDGRPVTVPELKVRVLLADLLAHVGEPVPVDRLVHDLWDDDLPANPVQALQLKVSRLRRVLEEAEPGGRDLVVSRAPGYLLRTDAVDAIRFAALVARAHDAQDVRTRAELLDEALGLWRGDAFADFADEEFARSTVPRLVDQRLSAVEARAEARLALGEHDALTAELGGLVAEHPLRERLRALHLRAFYRAGRQQEALAGYAEFRTRLADELGIDPTPELVAVHQSILEQDPALAGRTTLPTPLGDLIGRAEAVAEVCALLGAHRLVTLTGPGGVGKTRLAITSATRLAEVFPDGVRLVEFAGHTGPDDAVAAALGVRADGPTALASALRDRRTLLVLDNCEHLVDEVAGLADLLLRAAPGLRVLATSRQPLGLSGERVWTVPPLDIGSAVRLFTARAGVAVDADLAATICRRLDGIPLALELAATRVRALGAAELAARLDDRFRLLSTGHRGAPARQRTLRAVIDWSWGLLTEPERLVLRRLAVHVDGFALEAAESICAEDGLDVVDLLARLVDRSLVAVVHSGHETRYRLPESVAAYCVERLREAGESDLVRDRHRRYYADWARRHGHHLHGPDQRGWLERFDRESTNLRVEAATAWYWFLRGRLTSAHRMVDDLADPWQAGIALLAGDRGTPLPATTDPRALWFLGFALFTSGGDLAVSEDLVDRASTGLRAAEDRWGVAAALSTGVKQAMTRGDLAAVERDAERSLALFTELGDRWGVLQAVYPLAALAEVTGDYERARELHAEGLRLAEDLGVPSEAADRLTGLGRIALLTGDHAAARELHERAARLAADHGYRAGEVHAVIGLALGARREGDPDRAERHLRDVLDWHRHAEFGPGPALILAELGFVAEQRGDAEAAMSLHLEGFEAALGTGDPRAVALALEGVAGARVLAGHADEAARLLGAATAARESAGAPLPPGERGDVDRIAAKALAALGERGFAAEFEHGRARSVSGITSAFADADQVLIGPLVELL